MRALGLDLGTERVGVALSDSAGSLATPYEVVARVGDRRREHARIAELVDEAGAEIVVVGLPLSLDGSVGVAAQGALDEVDQLAGVLAVPVVTHDERLTTVTAERDLRAQGLRGPARRRVVDKVAAAIMLQAWLDHRRAPDPEVHPR